MRTPGIGERGPRAARLGALALAPVWVLPIGSPLAGLASWVTDVVHSLGYVGVAGLLALENLVPPIPSELILPLAGFLVSQGRFAFPSVVAAATVGSLAGALGLYGLGRWLGDERLRHWLEKVPLFSQRDLDRARDWFERHGAEAVLLGRCVPGLRSVISIPAGLEAMPLWKFVAYTALGSGVWNAALIGLGWAFGSQWQRVSRYAEIVGYVALGAVALLGAWFLWRRWRSTD